MQLRKYIFLKKLGEYQCTSCPVITTPKSQGGGQRWEDQPHREHPQWHQSHVGGADQTRAPSPEAQLRWTGSSSPSRNIPAADPIPPAQVRAHPPSTAFGRPPISPHPTGRLPCHFAGCFLKQACGAARAINSRDACLVMFLVACL